MQTDLIRYNLTERGRTYRGKPRNFDIPSIVAAINSGPCQEKVKHRDMLGYYGHWPRVKFGMNPAEGGVVDGKAVRVEPAIVTTHLKAFDDGTIEHRAEFLDNDAGKLAYNLYKSKAGGFSSAIDEFKRNGPEFYGFDYVLEPNYSTNRGYEVALDSALTLDAIEAVEAYNEHIGGMARLLDSVMADRNNVDAAYRDALKALATVSAENETYISLLTRGKALDSVSSLESVEPPLLVDRSGLSALERNIKSFKTADLGRFEPLEDEAKPADKTVTNVLDSVLSR
jgi:hypothetical protein